MTRTVLLTFAALVADGLAGLTGGLLSDRFLRRRQDALIAFAAGTLLAAVFLDILPEAIDSSGGSALSWAFAGFLALAVLEWLLGGHHHHHGHDHGPSVPALPAALLVSDALHNIGDGAALAAAFLISPAVGASVAIAVVVHEVPQEIGDYAILRAAGWLRRPALAALAAVQLTAFAGAAVVLLAARRFDAIAGAILSVAAGSFLYIGATDLLPDVHAEGTPAERRERIAGFLAGCLVLFLTDLAARALVS